MEITAHLESQCKIYLLKNNNEPLHHKYPIQALWFNLLEFIITLYVCSVTPLSNRMFQVELSDCIVYTAIKCPSLSDPRYGSVQLIGYTPGSTALYKCNVGYKLVGHSLRKCYNGYWTGKEPVCRSKQLHQSIAMTYFSGWECYYSRICVWTKM